MNKVNWIGKCLGLILACFATKVQATHNLAGQITAEYKGNNTYDITLTTYTDPAPANVDRCSANIEIWSLGPTPRLITIIEDIPRANGPRMANIPSDCPLLAPLNGEVFLGTVKKNLYFTTYTFPGPGKYELRYYDIARREDVINMPDPGSTAFYVETVVDFINPILGDNNTPVLLNDPLDEACIGKLWTHNPGGIDPDGDSLTYRLRQSFEYEPPQGKGPQVIPGYTYPDDPDFFPDNGPITQDPETGLITWEVPGKIGTYNIAFIVEEYRNGRLLGSVVRDMAILVKDCDNDPPIIESIDDTCVIAGDILQIDFKAWDPNEIDSVYLELNNGNIGNNGPFSVDNTATIEGVVIDQFSGIRPFLGLPVRTRNNPGNGLMEGTIDTIQGVVTWETICENIRTQPYQIDFFAHDNDLYASRPGTSRLTANKTVTIRVIPPGPEMLTITKTERQIQLDWLPTECDNALGYNVYRKVGMAGFMQDTICCEMTPLDMGYELLDFLQGWDSTTYRDMLTDITIGEEDVCYLITAIYPDAFNPSINVTMESCASNEACVELENDIVFMTNDSVRVTDAAQGEIFLSWSKPDFIDPFFPRPLSYKLFRGPQEGPPTDEIATLSFADDDTTYIDTGLNTLEQGYDYKVELFDASGLKINLDSVKSEASSIYLMTQGGNNTVALMWTEYVSWTNSEYEIWRAVDGGPYELLTTVNGTGGNSHSYQDLGLDPDIEYCYFVRSRGTHNRDGIKPVLINDSQTSCSLAIDNQPPCTPSITVDGDCDVLQHVVTITKSMELCANDTDELSLFFSSDISGPFEEVATFTYESFGMDTVLIFDLTNSPTSVAGCYSLKATDSLGNVSDFSEPICFDFCPVLELGNVFSPNGDGINDYFTPIVARDIELIQFEVFDRWGRRMHSNRTDLERLWEGQVLAGNRPAAEGVYYYAIQYRERGLDGGVPRQQTGWITLLR